MTRRKTIEDCLILAKTFTIKCLGTEYKNNKTKMEWECEKSHRFWSTYDSVQQNKWCATCSGCPKITIQDCQKLAKTKFNGKCLSTEYKNGEIKLEWVCYKGRRFWSSYNNTRTRIGCKICSGCIKKTIPDCQKLAKTKFNGKCLSTEYKNNMTKLEWECEKKHKFCSTYSDAQHGYWCPICRESKGERKVREI